MTVISTEFLLLIGSLLFFVSLVVGKAGHKLGVPVLLLFLVVGMLFGSDGFGLNFQNVQIAQTIGTICLCIILFSGGLDTKFHEIKPIIAPGIVMSTVGVILTALFTGLFVWFKFGHLFSAVGAGLFTCFLLAATVSSTDSASVFGILRSRGLNLKNNLRPLLELESGSNDPMAYMLTIVLMSIIQSGDHPSFLSVTGLIVMQLTIGAIVGFLMGKISVRIMNGIRMDNPSLYPVLLLVLGVFSFSSTYFLKGNGYLAVYITGLVLGNSKFPQRRSSMKFMDGFAWMSQILLFLTLGLLVNPRELLTVLIPALVIAFFVIFVARPLSIFLSLAPFRNIHFKDKIFVSWVGLRGAVPILFSILPLASGIAGARIIFNIVFVITIVSLLFQGTTLSLVAKCLGVSEKPKYFRKIEEFDVEFSEDIKSAMTEINITKETLKHGRNLIELPFPERTLVVMVKRGDHYFVPTGKTELHDGDILLVISDDDEALHETYRQLGILDYSFQKNK